MNIAIMPSAFYPSLGGIEELVRQFAHQLKRLGHNPILITNRWPRSLPLHEVFEGLPLYRLPLRVPVGSAKARVSYHLTHRTIRRQVVRILREHQAEMIHIHGVTCNARYALHAKRTLGLPLVVTMQGELTMDPAGMFERHQFSPAQLRDLLEKADAVTGVSRKTLSDGEAFCGRSFGDKSRVIFNGANLDDFRTAKPHVHHRPYILAIGRLVPQKGFDKLLQALAAAKLEDLDLILAGDGTERANLERQAHELGVSEQVVFFGRADRTQAAALFRGCEFFVIPSSADEGLPVVTAEAMAAGKAIVGTRSGGVPEAVLDEETGLLVDRGDVAGLTAAIRRLADDPALTQRLAEAGRERAEAFSWPVITDQYVQLYEHVMHGRASTATAALAGA